MSDTGWAMPEQPPAQAAGPRPPSPSGDAASEVAAAPAVPVPVLAVFSRPLTTSDVLDGAFQVIKARPRAMVTIAASFVIPVGALIALTNVGLLGGDLISILSDPATYEEGAASQSEGGFGLTILSTLVSSALVTLMAAPIAAVVAGWSEGRDLTAFQAFRAVGSSWISVVVAFVLVHVLEGIGTLLLVLPGLAAMVFMMVVTPVVAVEGAGPGEALRRSYRLVKHRFWNVLWIALLSALVANILSLLLPLLPLALTALFGFGGEQYVVAAGTIAASLLTFPFLAASAVLVYFDLRVRAEGMDLDLALVEQFDETQ